MSAIGLPKTWNEQADVVVVGSGFAGLAAAIAAKNVGSSVLILGKMKACGGNSIVSDGCIAAASSTLQRKNGVQDSPELLHEDMLRAGFINHHELVRTVAERSNAVVQWTADYLGVKYRERLEQLGGHSVPRTYITYNQSGRDIVRPLLSKVKELGIEVRTRVYLNKLIIDADGSIKGVKVHEGYIFPDAESGSPKYIKARNAVILATGGYGNDIPFRAIQNPRLTEDVDSTNKPGTTAEALIEAMKVGAASVHLSWIQMGPWTSPDEKGTGVGPIFASLIAFPYGVVVDPATGRRFINELADRRIRADAILNIGKPCIAIADADGVIQSGQNIHRCLKKGVVRRFDTMEELATAYKIPHEKLKETVSRYNSYVANQKDEEFEKPILKGSKPLVHPPYYGIRLWPKVHYTMGGILINTKAQVINLCYQPIKRLYAAGEVTGGVHGACRLGSLAIADCLVFGRIAGMNAAAEKPWI